MTDYIEYFAKMNGPFLEGKIVLLAGNFNSISTAIYSELSAYGAKIICMLPPAEERTARDAIPGEIISCTMENKAAVKTAIYNVLNQYNTLDILINNFDFPCCQKGISQELNDWNHILHKNLDGIYNVSANISDIFKKRRSGKILNITYLCGKSGQIPSNIAYVASKAAIIGFNKSLAAEMAEFSVTVNAIAIGLLEKSKELEEWEERIPLRRGAKAEEIAAPIAFLVSPFSDWTTGYCMNINGGMYLE